MGRHKQVGKGTSMSSRVRVVPVFNQPVDSRKLAQAILAMIHTGTGRPKGQHRPSVAGPGERDGAGQAEAPR